MKYACTAIIAISVLQFGCSMNREAAKRSYLENGNRLFDKGSLEEASLNYRKAIQKDAQYGEAYYRLGLCESRRTNLGEAFAALSRAVELLPQREEVKIALADTSLALYLHDHQWPAHEEAVKVIKTFQQPESFDALRIKGYLALADKNQTEAINYLRRASEIKPMHPDVTLAYTQALLRGDNAQVIEGEALAVKLVAAHPDFKPIYDILYGRYMSTNRVAEAERLLNSKAQNNPKDADSLVQLARHYWNRGNQHAAGAMVERLLGNRDIADSYLRAGDFYRSVNQLDRALDLYGQGRNIQPRQALACETHSIEVLSTQGKRDEAMRRVEDALKNHRNNGDLILLKATLLVGQGGKPQAEEAAGMLQTLLKQENKPQYHNALGEAYLALGDVPQAEKELATAASTAGYLEPQRTLARVSIQRSDYRRALEYADSVLAAAPNDSTMRLLRAAALRGQGNFNQANTELQSLRKEFPNALEPRLEMAALRVAQGNLKEAEGLFQGMGGGPTPDLRVVKGLAQTYLLDKQPAKAIQLLQDQIKAQPSRAPQLHILVADAAMVSNRLDLAVQEFAEAAKAEPKSSYVQLRWGDALMQQGQLSEAINHLRAAHDSAPADAEPLAMLALAYDKAGQVNEAQQTYSEVLKLQRTNPAVLNNLAYILANKDGNLDQAMQMAQEAQRRAPNDPGIADTVGWIYLKKHMVDAAIQIFSKNVRVAPNNPLFRYHLALALTDKGDRPGAKHNLEAALEYHPAPGDEADIRKLLIKVQ